MDALLATAGGAPALAASRRPVPDAEGSELVAVLAELCQAVGADGGGALYLDDSDGTLELAVTTANRKNRATFFDRLLSRSDHAGDGRTLILRLAGGRGSPF